jgi:hypothetical protein
VANVDDGESGAAQPDTVIKEDTELVRPAMANQGQHLAQVRLGDRVTLGHVQYASDATHGLVKWVKKVK